MKIPIKKVQIHTTISALSLKRAQRLMEDIYGMTDLNDLFERLIMEEYEHRYGKILLSDKSSIALKQSKNKPHRHQNPGQAESDQSNPPPR